MITCDKGGKTEQKVKILLTEISTSSGFDKAITSNNIESLMDKIDKQVEKGINKYGGTLDDKNLTEEELINHAIEEGIDFSFYLINLYDKVFSKEIAKKGKGIVNYHRLDVLNHLSSAMLHNCLLLENFKDDINE